MPRVAITGLGTINPIGNDIQAFKEALQKNTVGIDYITQFDPQDQKVKIAAEIKDFRPQDYLDRKKARRYDRYLQLSLIAAQEALEDSGLEGETGWQDTAGVIVSSSIGGFKTLAGEFKTFFDRGPKATSPFLIPMMIADMASGVISMEKGIKGPNFSTMSACATSAHALIISTMLIKHGYTPLIITGGADAAIEPLPMAAFANMTALSRRNDDPKGASRPFDRERDGFVMGEGAGIFILEEEGHARQRGAPIYGYIDGFGMTGDAHHFSQSDPEGDGAARAMEEALAMASLSPQSVDLINCHATSTPVGDRSEVKAIRRVLGDHASKVTIQGSKALLGHGLGASGALELIAAILQAKEGFVHGMPSLKERDEEFQDLHLPITTEKKTVKTVIKNSFGFGGHNASLIFTKE